MNSLLQLAFLLEYGSNKGGDMIKLGLPSTNTTTMTAYRRRKTIKFPVRHFYIV